MEYLLLFFLGLTAAIALICSTIIHPKHNVIKIDKIAFIWLIITGSIHVFVEGYFAIYYETLQSDNSLIAQLLKEYSLSDSRYLTSDPFVVNVERITAVSNKYRKIL